MKTYMLLLQCALAAPSMRSRHVHVWVLTLPAWYFQTWEFLLPLISPFIPSSNLPLPYSPSVRCSLAICTASLYSCSLPRDRNHRTIVAAVFLSDNTAIKSRWVRSGTGTHRPSSHLSLSSNSQFSTIWEAVSTSPLPHRQRGVDIPVTFLTNK